MNLKLDAFFELVFSIFWLVTMVQTGYQTGNAPSIVWFAIHIVLTVTLIPSFFLARYGVGHAQININEHDRSTNMLFTLGADRAVYHHVAILSCAAIGTGRFLYHFATKHQYMGFLGIRW